MHELSETYGPVVRVGANELIFFDLESIKEIYGQSNDPPAKSHFYDGFMLNENARSVFTSLDRHEHSRQRRLLSHGFSQNALLEAEPVSFLPLASTLHNAAMTECITQLIVQKIQTFLSLIGKAAEEGSGSVEILAYFTRLYVDIVSLLSFDVSFDSLSGQLSPALRALEAWKMAVKVRCAFPWGRFLPIALLREGDKARGTIDRWADDCVQAVKSKIAMGTATNRGILKSMIEAKDDDQSRFTDAELRENSTIFLVGGSLSLPN